LAEKSHFGHVIVSAFSALSLLVGWQSGHSCCL